MSAVNPELRDLESTRWWTIPVVVVLPCVFGTWETVDSLSRNTAQNVQVQTQTVGHKQYYCVCCLCVCFFVPLWDGDGDDDGDGDGDDDDDSDGDGDGDDDSETETETESKHHTYWWKKSPYLAMLLNSR